MPYDLAMTHSSRAEVVGLLVYYSIVHPSLRTYMSISMWNAEKRELSRERKGERRNRKQKETECMNESGLFIVCGNCLIKYTIIMRV